MILLLLAKFSSDRVAADNLLALIQLYLEFLWKSGNFGLCQETWTVLRLLLGLTMPRRSLHNIEQVLHLVFSTQELSASACGGRRLRFIQQQQRVPLFVL